MKRYLMLCIAIWIVIGCAKKGINNDPIIYYHQFPNDALTYIQLPLNSYYIFEDSATLEKDSIIVVTSSLEKKYAPPGIGAIGPSAYYYQSYTLKMKSANNSTSDYWLSASAAADESVPYVQFKTQYNDLTYAIFLFPPEFGIIASMEVKGNTYTNVVKYEFYYPNENISGVYYWAKGIGIIKRQINFPGSLKTELLVRRG